MVTIEGMEKGSLSDAIAQVLRSEIAARGLTPAEFGRLAGMPKTTAWRRAHGETKITTDDLDCLASALGWTPEDLLCRAVDLRASGEIYSRRRRTASAQEALDTLDDRDRADVLRAEQETRARRSAQQKKDAPSRAKGRTPMA